MTAPAGKTALIIGASRGLGYALAAEYVTVGQSVPGVVDTIEAQAAKGGLQYLDYQGQTVRW
jgi:NAD(P)-dependent dehydrogenase (short-subunit alcohol dehydrogenase family)